MNVTPLSEITAEELEELLFGDDVEIDGPSKRILEKARDRAVEKAKTVAQYERAAELRMKEELRKKEIEEARNAIYEKNPTFGRF